MLKEKKISRPLSTFIVAADFCVDQKFDLESRSRGARGPLQPAVVKKKNANVSELWEMTLMYQIEKQIYTFRR